MLKCEPVRQVGVTVDLRNGDKRENEKGRKIRW